MTLREAILDALIDDGESIIQISEYLNFLDIVFSRKDIIEMLNVLFIEEKLKVAYPKDFKVESLISYNEIDELWFELTEKGRDEWNDIRNTGDGSMC